ncbi:MAG: hypothetical protein DDT30_01192 [Dehalococcoidia bacterium]|nr:hypothetical protein [Bacillota bacterium]MBT9140614.1 hypothetical protein [Bacillota bacterium]
MNTNPEIGHTARLLCEDPFWKMYGDFTHWRIDPFIRQLETKKQKGRILPFVRGLRLSAHLIYAIREILSGSGLTANWGHLLDKSNTFCSCECDVIIHHNGHIGRWDGTEKPIMDFRFIEQQKAVAVISCKSYLRSGDIDREYCELMKQFVNKIWLFSECCGPRSAQNIRSRALEYGYEDFWHLYTWSRQTDPEPNKIGWNKFVEEVRKLEQ